MIARLKMFQTTASSGREPASACEQAAQDVLLQLPEVRKQFDADGATVMRMSPAEFGAYMIADLKKWERVVKEGGIKPE
jgi:hypothetical protein